MQYVVDHISFGPLTYFLIVFVGANCLVWWIGGGKWLGFNKLSVFSVVVLYVSGIALLFYVTGDDLSRRDDAFTILAASLALIGTSWAGSALKPKTKPTLEITANMSSVDRISQLENHVTQINEESHQASKRIEQGVAIISLSVIAVVLSVTLKMT